jgi:predicted nucleotidyltransferase
MMSDVSPEIAASLGSFVDAAKAAFGADLSAVVLYGSAASDQLRSHSDVNVLVLLKRFEQARADALREAARLAHAAIDLQAMFVLEDELADAAEAFAVKFTDIIARHRVLFGDDPFGALRTSRAAILARLKQVLLNQQLRLRERYILVSLREEQLADLIADCAGPLRAAAMSLLQLEGQGAHDGKAALESVVADSGDAALAAALQTMSSARADAALAPGEGAPALMGLMQITALLRARVARLQ